jgi:2'-5' RNA ligase
MSNQSLLPGFTYPKTPTDHLFLAIFPDARAGAHIIHLAHQLRARHGMLGQPFAIDRLHATLFSLGTYSGVPEGIVRGVGAVCAAIAAAEQPFEVRFDCVGSFARNAGKRPFVLRDSGSNTALLEFHQRLGAALGGHGNLSFTPHITLLYDEQSIAEEPVVPVIWQVNEFALVHSLQGQSRYIRLDHWTLHG